MPDSARINMRTIRRVDELLAEVYGEWLPSPGDPLDGLVRTILSQSTTDKASLPAFDRLKTRFPEWEEALEATPADIAEVIRDAGLAPTKSRRIHELLAQVKSERGELSLDHVCAMSLAAAWDYLCGFVGVGPKTTALVLLFDCGMPFFPVDTHVFRVSTRLGWLPPGSTSGSAHERMRESIPDELHLRLHLNIVEHGRAICHARKPVCEACVLRRFCAALKSGETP